ncbi:MAG: Glycerol uptake operon antiterminator regulatory protein [Firmicutes bacterium]|nr:Glycerol uptake operon antiterminator regulatory protein [candidate division NPL-UPA2 bacterium]
MISPATAKIVGSHPIVPAPRNAENFRLALSSTPATSVIVLFGDINDLPGLLDEASKWRKRLIIHLDLCAGLGKDRAGLKLIARMGITAVLTTKTQLVRLAQEEGLLVVQRLFLVDSESVRTGLNLLKNTRPDMLEVLPAVIPAPIIANLLTQTRLPIMAGGLLSTHEEISRVLKSGVTAVSTSCPELWT